MVRMLGAFVILSASAVLSFDTGATVYAWLVVVLTKPPSSDGRRISMRQARVGRTSSNLYLFIWSTDISLLPCNFSGCFYRAGCRATACARARCRWGSTELKRGAPATPAGDRAGQCRLLSKRQACAGGV